MYHNVETKTSANVLWKKLNDLCEKETAKNKLYLSKNFEFKTHGVHMVDHLNNLHSLVNELATVKIMFDDEFQALLLNLLLDSFETLVVILSIGTK